MTLVDPTINASTQAGNSTAVLPCTHCGLPVPKGLVKTGAVNQFCCGGCRMAYQLIHSCGLDAFYQMAETQAEFSLTNRESESYSDRFDEFDQPSFRDQFGKIVSDEVEEITLLLDGIHCAACIPNPRQDCRISLSLSPATPHAQYAAGQTQHDRMSYHRTVAK